MNIAIMYCRKLTNKCSGTGCFKVCNESIDKFSIYKDKETKLCSFFTCSGCNDTLLDGEDWEHKIKQLKNNNVENIHMATCIEIECHDLESQETLLTKEGFNVINGTHK